MKFPLSLFASVLALTLLLNPVTATADQPLEKQDVEAIVKKYIEEHPEVIIKSVETYEMKQRQAEMKQHLVAASKAARNIGKPDIQQELNNDPDSPSAGNPQGDITVVEFFDYHCGWCKRLYPNIAKLVKEDKKVRIVFKDLPILALDSTTASEASIAFYHLNPKKYFEYHTALINMSGPFTLDNLSAEAKKLGVSPEALKKAMDDPGIDKELAQTKQLSDALNIGGTPALIIGTDLIPGYLEYDDLKGRVDEARKGAGK